ncbi:hypothetical protein FM113_17490 [Leucobacter sp. 7(1)]|uniref:hypothetical protein n=1 Tax=Leucobacter sp. 7(1) TaxID=1255613 RepID=UPI00097F293D|nr:hypothetical protein [Leucobacter sp. 7(1)]SJN13316.1 hypothetical protein FM113_17490 [Leucobacter sp. 7(1)]
MNRGPLSIGLRRSILLLPAGPIILAAYAITASTSTHPVVASWANIASALSAGATLLAPILAAATAWDATREVRSGGGPILRTAPRSLAAAILRQTIAAWLWGAALWLIVLAGLVVRAVIVGITGAPTIALLHGLLVVLVSVTIGATTAAALPGWAALPVAIIAPTMLYLAQFLDLGAPWLQFANPLRRIDTAQDAFTHVDSDWVLLRYALVLLVITALIAIIAVLRGPRRLVSTVAGAALIAAGVPVAAALAPAAERITVSVSPSELSFTTLTSEDPALTLHVLPQYAPLREDLLTRWGRIASLVASSELAFDTLSQGDGTVPDGGSDRFKTFALNPSSADPVTDSVHAALFSLVGQRCGTDEAGGAWPALGAVNVFLADDPDAALFAVDAAELNRLVDALRSKTLPEAQTWFAEHSAAYLDCSLRPEDIIG